MYLSSEQHDKLRTIVMGFEIPFRTYIANILTEKYGGVNEFSVALLSERVPEDISPIFKSQINKLKSQPERIYNLLEITIESMNKKVIAEDVNVPDVASIVALILLFQDAFTGFVEMFTEREGFLSQIEKYHYVRNKLNHPGCKTLEEQDLALVLNFISNACIFIAIEREDCFWDKTEEKLYKEIKSLESIETGKYEFINNFEELPLLDHKIVCREKEIDDIKRFIYGIKGALRKKVSLSIYGYGGVGKTALVIEGIKSIIRDVVDETTLNYYKPDFILFFTAKEETLDVSFTTGNIQRKNYRHNFSSFDELRSAIFEKLNISDFEGYSGRGIIIIDNLETLERTERAKINEFIEYMSPSGIQYIVTSRNEEECEERMKLGGFEATNGKNFIKQYIDENELDLQLSDGEQETLLEMSKGNTLVLVLSLRRLSKKMVTIEGIVTDLSKMSTVQSVSEEILNLPANGYEIISEFMFKNTFIELEERLIDHKELFTKLLQVFAVFPKETIDIYTMCLLLDVGYAQIEPYLNMLCRFLILERKGDNYAINSFAEKYIVQRFLTDREAYEQLSTKIEKSVREIDEDLRSLNDDLEKNSKVKDIIDDWFITYEGDKIAAAKAYHLYQTVNQDCQKGTNFFVESAYREINDKIVLIEKMTMHPYVKFQKARMLQLVYLTGVLGKDVSREIEKAFVDCIWVIKNNALYLKIKSTKNYASVLWIFGSFLYSIGKITEAIRYLEEGYSCFGSLGKHDKEFYQCCSFLGRAYLDQYKENGNKTYLQKSRNISDILYAERSSYMSDKGLKGYATQLRKDLNSLSKSTVGLS